ncbi:hypothetical protein CALCODRAFT_103593 [Calocera cornea HHB12733]|uniref:Uncharacterized protein n=1 Tax=Calocera cornea HHB12733 TaxID=1353952 RepID=A0A165D4Z0_9BASI|nr:hypothetical protein CALCODRAFT_103593 [Calocera cornea HHB12733]
MHTNTTPPPYSQSPATPTSEYSSRPSSSLSAPDLPDIDVTSEPDDLPPSIDGYAPAPQEALPVYPERPAQYVFLSLDVLNSVLVDAASGERVLESVSEEEGETRIRYLAGPSLEEGERTVCRIAWPSGSGRKALAGPTVDFGQGALILRKWMARAGHSGALLRVRHRGKLYDVYQAGSALGVRYTPHKSQQQRTSTRHPMLLGIRDPLKHVELLLSPQLTQEQAREVLEIGALLAVLLKSKRQLGPDFEERMIKDRLWKGLDRCFRSIGNAQRGQVLR